MAQKNPTLWQKEPIGNFLPQHLLFRGISRNIWKSWGDDISDMVFEDDVKFIVDDPEKHLKIALSQIGNLDWYLFYLGANTHEKLIKIKPNLILLKNGYSTHSLAYNKKVFNKLIRKYKKIKIIKKQQDIQDVYLAEKIQSKHICLMVNPMLTTQMNDYSDIEKQLVNQNYIEERFKKNIKKK